MTHNGIIIDHDPVNELDEDIELQLQCHFRKFGIKAGHYWLGQTQLLWRSDSRIEASIILKAIDSSPLTNVSIGKQPSWADSAIASEIQALKAESSRCSDLELS